MVQVFYFFRSVFLRGPVNTARLIRAELIFEKKFGIRTATVKRNFTDEFFHYQGASYLVLLRIFPQIIAQTKHLHFTDIGSGKGRAIFVAEYCGYDRLTGLELDGSLVDIAKSNIDLYRFKRKGSTIEFINANALEFNYRNEPTLYFLFNPFNEVVLDKVLDGICAATRSETWLVYMNPRFTAPFNNRKMEVVMSIKTGFYKEAIVYRLNPASTRS